MITVSILGGLGNQMFQYAAAKALACRNGVDLAIDDSAFEGYRLRSFMLDRLRIPELDSLPAAVPRVSPRNFAAFHWRNRVNRVLSQVGFKSIAVPGTYTEPHFHFDPAFLQLKSPVSLFGYFQSERYFGEIADDLRRYFQPREPLGRAAQDIADAIAGAEMPVSIHIRRGDYVTSAETARVHGTLGFDYYRKALDLVQHEAGRKITLFVFSDDAEAAADLLRFYSGKIIEVRGDPERPWDDMALMARCRHHVIANSSFSWWGAWLNPSSSKIVIAPRAWFSQEGMRMHNICDLHPPTWMLL